MLDAWARGKRRRERGEYEDEVFSVVVGHLQYFPVNVRAHVFLRLLRDYFNDGALGDNENVRECSVELWPNIAADGGRIEPDAIVHLMGCDGTVLTLLIEAKWDALQSESQLSIQWGAATATHDIDRLYHVFLTRHVQVTEQMLGPHPDRAHAEHLRNITWRQLGNLFSSVARQNPGSREFMTWVGQITRFLARLGDAPFVGVSTVCENSTWQRDGLSWKYQSRTFRLRELLDHYNSCYIGRGGHEWRFKRE